MSTICSVNTFGGIYIWSTITTEKWGAFAAHFEELDENLEYIEKEDEFDIVSWRCDAHAHMVLLTIFIVGR